MNEQLIEYQVTLFCPDGRYKPVSAIVKKDMAYIRSCSKGQLIKDLRKEGVQKICIKRNWTSADIRAYGYTELKIRRYDREKIQIENAERYQQIKIEKGWVRNDAVQTKND